jgi:integrase
MLPQDLQEFMRHSSLQVTMEYYVGRRPAEVAARMWEVRRKGNGEP